MEIILPRTGFPENANLEEYQPFYVNPKRGTYITLHAIKQVPILCNFSKDPALYQIFLKLVKNPENGKTR
jgi:hypothetical protein